MSEKVKTGGLAFPLPMGSETTQGSEGMTLRDYFAAKVIAALIPKLMQNPHAIESATEYAYKVADAMLEAKGDK